MEINMYKFYYIKILIYAKSFVAKLVNISWCVSIIFRVQIPPLHCNYRIIKILI